MSLNHHCHKSFIPSNHRVYVHLFVYLLMTNPKCLLCLKFKSPSASLKIIIPLISKLDDLRGMEQGRGGLGKEGRGGDEYHAKRSKIFDIESIARNSKEL